MVISAPERYFVILLTKGRYALVDEADFVALSGVSWYACRSKGGWYAAMKNNSGPTVFLHRFIMAQPPGLLVDHVNGDGLDCRRSNMRIATHQQNVANSRAPRGARFKGVRPARRGGKVYWAAQVKAGAGRSRSTRTVRRAQPGSITTWPGRLGAISRG